MVRIVLAESSLSEIDLIRMSVVNISQVEITVTSTYNQLIENIIKEQPQLVLLGNIDVVNYFEICRECHKISSEIPIILLSQQEVVNDSFQQVLQSYGLTDIICSSDSEKLYQFIAKLKTKHLSINEAQAELTATGRVILVALEEIVAVSNKYFGPLAQGNYWRKAHTQLVDQFPFLQNWSSDHFSQITCDQKILDLELTAADIQSIRQWVHFFIKECERIIVDFQEILENSNFSPTTQ
ncbi:MAG: hypothetical protein ACEQSC_01980, partial [Candidatus Nanopelagicaceae bacterium]